MKLTPVTGPGAIPPNGTPEHVRSQRAIQAFNKGQSSYDRNDASAQSQTSGAPPVNQNNVGVEQLAAIQPPKQQEQQSVVEQLEAQGEVQDVPSTPEVEEPKQDPALSRQFAQLARQERALRASKQQWQTELKSKEAALAAREAALQTPAQPDLTKYISVDQLKRDAYGTLTKLGVSYDEFTQQAMNHQQVPQHLQNHIQDLEAKIAKLQESSDNSTKTYAEQQQQQYQAAVRQIEQDVVQLVKSDPQTYEVIAKTGKGSIKEVVKLIEETYNKDGYVMSVEEAAQEVEDYMAEQSWKTLSQIDKIKKRMNQAPATPKTSDVKQQTQTKPQMKTLTNTNSSTRQLSARERALLAFKGELKS